MSVPELSTIEEQVVLLFAGGRSSRVIADELGLSLSTIEWHVVRARGKLERVATLHDRIQQRGASAGDESGVDGTEPAVFGSL